MISQWLIKGAFSYGVGTSKKPAVVKFEENGWGNSIFSLPRIRNKRTQLEFFVPNKQAYFHEFEIPENMQGQYSDASVSVIKMHPFNQYNYQDFFVDGFWGYEVHGHNWKIYVP